jgi:hypothetical protein
MDRLFLTVLMIGALCFAGSDCGSAKVQSPQSPETKPSESPASPNITLTDKHPSGSWPVAANLLASDSEVLEVTINKVVNPAMTPVAIYAYLSNTEKDKSETERHPVGNFSLYPPDQPGKFLLSGKALQRIYASGATSKAHEARLVFEMKRIDETKAWTPVEVTIAQPTWRPAEK